jgi:cell division septation protein DedD
MGRRSAQNAAAAVIIPNGSPAITSANKPTAGSASPPTLSGAPTADEIPSAPAGKATHADAAIVGDVIPKTSTAQPAPAAALKPDVVATAAGSPSAAVPPIAANGSFMVQVAAVSTQEIADLELAALRKFNYVVVVRHEPADQLLHIQIGPFATRKDAEAMRQNVLSHGFNAIVK